MKKPTHIFLSCLIGVIICLLIAGVEGWVTAANSSSWYDTLNKPPFNPPSFIFGPVWTILYIMIGIAGGLLWQRRNELRKLFVWFVLQLIFNFLWSFLFFAGQFIGLALLDLLLLWMTLFITLIYAYRHYITVGYLLTPYFLWVNFALILNLSLWVLN